MIQCKLFFNELEKWGLDFFTGVPDSLLSSLSAWLLDQRPERHVIAANEGNAVGIAAGYYMATQKIPVVYMQNSGIGNTVNPVASLLHKDVYQIPMLFLIGWRGEPGIHDEPQHVFQGRATISMLEQMEIRTEVLSTEWEKAQEQIREAVSYMRETGCPYAFVVHKGTYDSYPLKQKGNPDYPMTRERALEILSQGMLSESAVISTTGKMSRELFEIRERNAQGHQKDFLTVGSMGHASSIAMGIAKFCDKTVYCLDGDGALLMHMGALATIGQSGLKNFKHILINNGCHESVGGQPTKGFRIQAEQIALACGYRRVYCCKTEKEVELALRAMNQSDEIELMQIFVNAESREDLGRPTISAIENKKNFMNYLSGKEQ